MKEIFKMINLLVFGLLTAIVIYPLLHEMGHIAVALLTGADIVEIGVLPTPFIACEISTTDYVAQVLIGLSGNMLSFVIPMFLCPKNFWLWYIVFVTRTISIFAVFLSLVSAIIGIDGIACETEDIVKVLQIFPNGKWLLVIMFSVMMMYGIIKIVKERPILKCEKYFGVQTQATA